MSGSKHVELLKTPVVPVRSDDLDTSLTVDFDDENKNNEEDAFTQDPSQQQNTIATSKPKRVIRKPARYTDIVEYALSFIEDEISSTRRG